MVYFERASIFVFLWYAIIMIANRLHDDSSSVVLAWSSGRSTQTTSTRRAWFQQQAAVLAVTGSGVLFTSSQPALAAGIPTPQEIEKLRRGHARVQYLLEHWNEETQVCGKIIMSDVERKQVIRTDGAGSGGCEKTPLNVQNFLGYKSTEDPLYRADKLMVRAAPLVNPDDFENYLDVVEKYKDKADNSAMMAYTSSWGEANPNGGKDVIDEYLERTKTDVEDSERYLRQILGYLKLEPLPPSKNPK
mmetsp:Transcript_9354/g.25744  ORF Transcript_9354/g.25744 Transcript_9354/m.25744 type:complete len:247 (-) Transcript_9354:884-1624(-)